MSASWLLCPQLTSESVPVAMAPSKGSPPAPVSPPAPPELHELCTEAVNPATKDIDMLSTVEMCRLINAEDALVAAAVADIVPAISKTIDQIVDRINDGGRLLYMGAGTSGTVRLFFAEPILGVLDLSDIPLSFNVDPMRYVALTAGGDAALRLALRQARRTCWRCSPSRMTTLIGITASGRTPYVLGALQCARTQGLLTVGIVCSRPNELALEGHCDHILDPLVGPEIISGSTRLKAGTATKMILNMISTAIQVKLGNTYGNLVHGRLCTPRTPSSQSRARHIIRNISGPRAAAWTASLRACGGSVKLATVAVVSGWGVPLCVDALERRGGSLRSVLEDVRYETVVRVFV
ncbi:N-acetylmuramic acid-6-phosphate etherase [Mycena rebaudengoi]|nr:N-acetylmuramic acid-6-phosphate etherase [Mycena rebaudengoi]